MPSLAERIRQAHGGQPLIIAHRGYSSAAPENTMAAFSKAMDAGADMLELDVSLSRDACPVIIHDDGLERTTNGSGLVEDHDLEALRKLDAGSWFHEDFAGEGIPLLSEVCKGFAGRLFINVELKSLQGNERRTLLVEVVTDLTSSGKLLDTLLFSSFDHDLLFSLRQNLEQAHIGVLAHGAEALHVFSALHAASYHPNIRETDESLVATVHEAGGLVLPWAAAGDNTAHMMQKCLQLHCDGFFADDPERFRSMVHEQRVKE
jgi:glycerophosphoryl diester phosphodiesterase